MSLKVRPFKTKVDEVEVEGVIEGREFICRFYGKPYSASIAEIGEDERGIYALVDQTQRTEPFGYIFRVEDEFDEDGSAGCQISLQRLNEALERMIRKQGIDPDSVNLIGGVAESISVFLDSEGGINGSSRNEPCPFELDKTM